MGTRKNRTRPPRIRKEVWMRVKNPAQIRRWRKQRHFSQRDLAYLVRRSQSTIYLLETGGMTTCSEDLALAIAARLDVPWEDLFEAHEESSMREVTSGIDSRQQRHSA